MAFNISYKLALTEGLGKSEDKEMKEKYQRILKRLEKETEKKNPNEKMERIQK